MCRLFKICTVAVGFIYLVWEVHLQRIIFLVADDCKGAVRASCSQMFRELRAEDNNMAGRAMA